MRCSPRRSELREAPRLALFLSRKGGAVRTARKEPGCWRLPGLCLSVWPGRVPSSGLFITHGPRVWSPGDRMPWKAFRQRGRGCGQNLWGHPGLPCAERLRSSYLASASSSVRRRR